MSRNTSIYTTGPPELSDDDLMQRVQAHDIAAFEQLYVRYSARTLGLARMVCGSREHAEEAVQDGFLALWRSRDRYDKRRGTPQTWIFALVRNRSIDIRRRNRAHDNEHARRAHLEDLVTAISSSVEDDAIRHEDAACVRGLVHQLPASQRDVIVLAYFGGLTHVEIAERLAAPLGTVKSRMRLGLSTLATIERNSNTTPNSHAA